MTTKYRIHIGRSTFTLICNPRVRAGVRYRRGQGHGDMGIPYIGVLTWLRRTNHIGAKKFGLEQVNG